MEEQLDEWIFSEKELAVQKDVKRQKVQPKINEFLNLSFDHTPKDSVSQQDGAIQNDNPFKQQTQHQIKLPVSQKPKPVRAIQKNNLKSSKKDFILPDNIDEEIEPPKKKLPKKA